MSSDMEILRRAYEREHDTRDRRPPQLRSWEYYTVGASRADVQRLLDEGLVVIAFKATDPDAYRRLQEFRQRRAKKPALGAKEVTDHT